MPELSTMYLGEELISNAYPHLSHVIQTGFANINGVNRFKDLPVYANPAMSSYTIPENSPDDVVLVTQKDGKDVSSYTNQDLVNSANSSKASVSPVVFMTHCMRTPLGVSTLLGSMMH